MEVADARKDVPLISLGIVVLESDLELNGLDEVPLLTVLEGGGRKERVNESSHAGSCLNQSSQHLSSCSQYERRGNEPDNLDISE